MYGLRPGQIASALLAVSGMGLIGAQFCLNALAAGFHPNSNRAAAVMLMARTRA